MHTKIKDILFIIIVGSVCSLLLLWIRSHTYPIIANHEALTLKTTILDAASVAYTLDNYETVFNKNIRTACGKEGDYYVTPDRFYIFEFAGRGLWGPIKGLITLRSDLTTLESIKIIAQEETPGLGGRIEEAWFLRQFKKKRVSPKLMLAMRKSASGQNEIDAISGATMTSAALIAMINESIEGFRGMVKESDASR